MEKNSNPLTSSQAAFPASLFRMQGEDWARAMTASSGRRCFDSYARLNPPSSWVKTFLGSLLTTKELYSPLSSLTWRTRVTRSRRLSYFRLLPSVPYIEEIGSGFVPTPDTTGGAPNTGSNKKNGPKSLMEFASLPTPTAKDSSGRMYTRDNGDPNKPRVTLAGVARGWPTPSAGDNRDRDNLSTPAIQRRIGKHQLNLSMVVSEESGQLNPTWVEWLMGFPLGWTDCEPSATE